LARSLGARFDRAAGLAGWETVAGCATIGPFSVFGVRMAPALENPPCAVMCGGETMLLAASGVCTRE
jgi:hypothetical protein